MRLVVDNNVMISGLLWTGTPQRLLVAARRGSVTLFSSTTLLAELAKVIKRPKFEAVLIRSELTVDGLLYEVRRQVEIVVPPPLPEPICRDPDDDSVLACAVAAQVDAIVSGDADLLDLKQYHGIPIMTPAQALQFIGPA